MDGKEPMYVHPPKPGNAHHTYLDEAGFGFVAKCFQALENRGNTEHYRVMLSGAILVQAYKPALGQF